MRENYFIYAAFMCSLAFAVSCSESGPQSQPANTPDALNSEIVIVGELVRVGRPVTLSIEVPTLGEDVEKAEYFFYIKENVLAVKEVIPERRICSVIWKAPEAKEYTLVFSVKYTFTKPDANGRFTRVDEVEKTVTVTPYDVRESYWGETLEEIQELYNNTLELSIEVENCWVAELTNSYGGEFIKNATTEASYVFTDNKLSFVIERNLYNYDEFNPFTYFINYCRLIEIDYGLISVEWSAVSEETRNAAQSYYDTFKNSNTPSDKKIEAREQLDVLFRYGSIAPAFTYKRNATQLIIKGGPYDNLRFEIRRQYGMR